MVRCPETKIADLLEDIRGDGIRCHIQVANPQAAGRVRIIGNVEETVAFADVQAEWAYGICRVKRKAGGSRRDARVERDRIVRVKQVNAVGRRAHERSS